MHFPELININKNDYILEIGPGSTPFYRSDIFLEIEYGSRDDFYRQCGGFSELKTDKKIVYYNGGKFPFKDKEFDYVICSHVLEHVDDVELFLSELTRVAKRGYLEFPTIYYEYVYNFDVHKNILYYSDNKIKWIKKDETPLNYFRKVNHTFLAALKAKQDQLIVPLKEMFIQGFEWHGSISSEKVTDIESLCIDDAGISNLNWTLAKRKKDFLFFYKFWKAICLRMSNLACKIIK